MARPEKNTVEYFPFICEDGKKMYYIEETYGNDGFAVFVKLLRELAKTEYHYLDLSKNTTIMFLSAKCKVTKETLISIINDLVELSKFDSMLWNENKVIWCQDFIDSIQDAYSRRNNNCITYNGLLQHLTSLCIRKPNNCETKDDDNTQTILYYNKLKKSIINKDINNSELNELKDLINKYYPNEENDNKFFENAPDLIKKFKDDTYLELLIENLAAYNVKISIEEIREEADRFINERLLSGDTKKEFFQYADYFRNSLKSENSKYRKSKNVESKNYEPDIDW